MPPAVVERLIEECGTPLYVYDLDRVDRARADLYGWLPDGVEVYYAFKANPHPAVVGALASGGHGRPCRAEVSSEGELAVALGAGYAGTDVLYTGPGKTARELRAAVDAGVTFSAESLGDLRHVGEAATAAGVVARCVLRINSARSGARTGIRMTGVPTQFGIDSETVGALRADLLAVSGVEIAGLHLYAQSNAADEDELLAELTHAVELAAGIRDELGIGFTLLDIGGGFAAPYAAPGERAGYPNLRAGLAAVLDRHFPGWRRGEPQVAVESGRYLVGDSGTLVAGVSNVKEGRGRRFVVLDVGINAFGGMSGLGRLLPSAVVPDSVRPERPGPTRPATLAGPLCTPGDVLAREVEIGPLAPGDVLTIPNVGAYGATASLLMFLGRPAPVEAVVRGDRVLSTSRIDPVRIDDFRGARA